MKKRLNKLNKQKNNSQIAIHNTFISVNTSINISSTLTKEEREERLALAKKQTDHIIYREMELLEDYKKDKELVREVIKGQLKNANKGQLFAFIVIVLGFVFSGAFAYFGMSGESIASIFVALATIASQFLDRIKPHSNKKPQKSIEKQG